ncbi:MAG TPA: GTPase HflX [Acidimicrobiia bacterium]
MSSPDGRARRRLTATEIDLEVLRQRALLVGTGVGSRHLDESEASLAGLALLADTAGADPVHSVLQRRDHPDPATYVGSGKVDELSSLAESLDIDVVVFDDELTPAQQRNLEHRLGRDVVDRVALILDIFAQHATSQEGMLQVELAQLRYRMPRLRGRGITLSQQGGGIGTRGPGETQLEVDRRRIQRRITKLEQDLKRLGRTRATQRKARRRRGLPAVALVGYTNAGKSTLLNRITDAEVRVEDRLFSTLDPTTRRLRLTGGETVLCSDTVGFVRRLPHELVEAFRSTLEMVTEADLILHVVDGAAPDAPAQIAAVHTVLDEIEATDVPELLIVNKVDIAEPARVRELCQGETALAVSAATGEGVDKLLSAVGDRLRALATVVELLVPYERGDVLAGLHRDGEVLVEVHVDAGTRVRARIDGAALSRYREFVTG